MSLKLKVSLASLCSVLLAVPAYAQSLPESALPGVLQKNLEQMKLPEKAKTYAPEKQKAPQKEVLQTNQQLSVELKEIRLSGVTKLAQDELDPIIKPFIGKPLTEQMLSDIKYAIAFKYFDKGYILIKVFSPPQVVSDGILDLLVVEGRIGSVVAPNIEQSGVSQTLIENRIKDLPLDMVFNQDDVETIIADLDNLADLDARVRLSPGQEFGRTNLNILLSPAEDEVQSIYVNNHGSSLTGQLQAVADLQKTNLFGLGETLSFTGNMSKGRDSQQYAFSAKLPTGYKGITADVSYRQSNQDIGWLFKTLRSRGESEIFEIAASKYLVNTARRSVNLRGGLTKRTHSSAIANVPDTKDDITQLFVEASYLKRRTNAVMYAQARLSRDIAIWGANDENDIDGTRAGAQRALIFEPTVYYSQRLSNASSFNATVRGQIASHRLPSSNLFSVGGYGSVRGFEPSYASAEAGISATLEYKHMVYNNGRAVVEVIPFVDWAAIKSRVQGSTPDRHLKSVGLAAEATFRPSEYAKEITLRTDVATPIGDYQNSSFEGARLYFSLGTKF